MTTKKTLLIDDVRTDADLGIGYPTFTDNQREPTESVLIARTFTLGLRALQWMGPWDVLYLDHDFGDPNGKTGYDIVCFLEEMAYEHKFFLLPKKLICVSSNPSGKARIEAAWKSIQDKLPDLVSTYHKIFNEKYKDIL